MTRFARTLRAGSRLPVDPDLVPDSDGSPHLHLRDLAAVGVGGFAGGLARYAIGLAWPTAKGHFPAAILTINTSGAFLLALVLVLALESATPHRRVRLVLGTGVCGAYTTFSSVAVAADQLWAHLHPTEALVFVVTSVAAGFAAAAVGMASGRALRLRGTR